MTIQLILCQIIVLVIMTFKAAENANSFNYGQTINHITEWLVIAFITAISAFFILHWTKYFAASLILSIGWALPYFNILLNRLRYKPWNYLGEGKGAALTDIILGKVKNYLLLVYILWLGAGFLLFYLIIVKV